MDFDEIFRVSLACRICLSGKSLNYPLTREDSNFLRPQFCTAGEVWVIESRTLINLGEKLPIYDVDRYRSRG